MQKRDKGRETGECIAKRPMWNKKRVEGTGRVTDVYYMVWEAESVLQVGLARDRGAWRCESPNSNTGLRRIRVRS